MVIVIMLIFVIFIFVLVVMLLILVVHFGYEAVALNAVKSQTQIERCKAQVV